MLLRLALSLSLLTCIGCSGGKETKTISTPSGPVQVTKDSAEPTPQSFSTPSEVELGQIRSDAARAKDFVKAYVPATNYALSDFDKAFYAWQRESPQRYASGEVVAMLGAYLGERLVSEQDMEWTVVTDTYGRDLAVRSKKVEVISYPFSSVTKRVERNQYDFMEGIYYAVQETIRTGNYKAR